MSMIKDICGTHAPAPHNEYICHGTAEQRRQILNKVKAILKKFDSRKCVLPDIPIRKYDNSPDCCNSKGKGSRNVGTPVPPLITYTGIQEIRPTGDPNKVIGDPPYILYKPAANLKRSRIPMNTPNRTKSVELKGGIFYGSCFCVKRNGLQGDCPRSDCLGRPECLAINPGPCCEPAKADYAKLLPEDSRRSSDMRECGNASNRCCCRHR